MELRPFHSYAIRVKSIVYRYRRTLDPVLLSLLQTTSCAGQAHLLPKLDKAQISVLSWDTLTTTMGLSHALRHLTLDLGFNRARTDAKGWSNDAVAAEYLENVARIASLQRLDLRGMALGSDRINRALTSMKSLRILSLTTGTSLPVATLAAIAAFPCLNELEMHAGHIDADELADSIANHETPLFPALQMLHVRARASLVELLLQQMPCDSLRRLVVEAEQPTQIPSVWQSAFNLIPAKATNSLRELTIEHHMCSTIELDSTSDNTPQSNVSEPGTQFTISTLRPLAQLPHLRRFVLDTTVAPDLCDADIEEVGKWWPSLEYLDLGGLLSGAECIGYPRKSRASLRCLEGLARVCPRLETLVINLDISSEGAGDTELVGAHQMSPHSIHSLTIGSISAPEPLRLSQYLRRVFPSLLHIDGVAAYEEDWRMVQSMLHHSRNA